MNRTLRTIVAAILVLVIAFSAISISQNIGKRLKLDITDQRLYSLSDGTKAILAKLHQPIKAKLYYAKTAALKGPDQIRYFNNYYEFVRALLEEYVTASNGMFELEVIDPRPFSGDETEALRLGLRRFPITQEENFFFGLVVQTPFGVEKAIPFFSPDRQKFVEYDISYLVDTAITRQKKRIGIMSSLPVMGDDASGYMAQMKRMQGQPLAPPWTIVEVLRRKYDVKQVDTDMDVNDVNDVDILLVVHPKDLPEKTQFAIDQYVLKGGKTIVFVDPHCIADQPDRRAMQMGTPPSQSSNLDGLMRTWGLEMPASTFAGDRDLALAAPVVRNQRPEKIIGYLRLTPGCFNEENVISAELNDLRLLFAGVIREIAEPNEQAEGGEAASAKVQRTPLLMTTDKGNSWKVTSPYELMMLDPSRLMTKFVEGTEPVSMGYLVTGRFKSAFPDGIEIEVEVEDDSDEAGDPNETKTIKKQIKGLTEAEADCAVVVFADADVISDILAYQDSPFGPLVVADNAALLLNTIDDLSGSSDLVSIRSRGNFKRPFTVVDEIRQDAEEDTAAEVTKLNAQIQGYNTELQSIVSSAKEGEEDVIGSTIVEKKRDLQLKIREAERQLNEVKLKRRERIEHLGNTLRQANMLLAPAVILVIAILLGIRRTVRKRHYISHASDA